MYILQVNTVLCILNRYERIVDLLVFHGADVNKTNPDIQSTPLYHAVALGSLSATQILINAGAELDNPFHKSFARAETVLHVAAGGGYFQVVETLLKKKEAAKFINKCNAVSVLSNKIYFHSIIMKKYYKHKIIFMMETTPL